MGQKANPIILRQNLTFSKIKSDYYAKSFEESSLLLYQDLEIRKYLCRIFFLHGMIIHSCKLKYSECKISIFLSYYFKQDSLKLVLLKKVFNRKIKFKKKSFFFNKYNKFNTNNKKNEIKKRFNNNNNNNNKKKEIKKRFNNNNNKKKQTKNLFNTNNRQKNKKMYLNKSISRRPKKRVKIQKKLNFFFNKKLTKLSFNNNFIQIILKCLSNYTNNIYDISLVVQRLNKGLSLRLKSYQAPSFRESVLKLRKYFEDSYFNETINIILIVLSKKNSAKLLADFIALQFDNEKKHYFFFNFFSDAMNELLKNDKIKKIKGVKILINGRFSVGPRSKRKLLEFGNLPIQTLSCHVDYSQSVSFTSNGTIGIKVWICEKKKLYKYVFTTKKN